jgi:hypothetical protein
MAEIRLNIDDKFFNDVKRAVGIEKTSQLTNEALTLIKWAANEVREGRIITTSKPDGSDVKKIVIPSLENLKSRL